MSTAPSGLYDQSVKASHTPLKHKHSIDWSIATVGVNGIGYGWGKGWGLPCRLW
jgi:hypothetical protein